MAMYEAPAVSIILPTFNRARMVAGAIESVQAQTFNDWELLIIDDGSVDATRDIVSAYARQDRRIRYVFQRNQGLSQTRANGLRMATGRYCGLLDDDDTYLPNKLRSQVAFLDAHPEVGLVYSYVEVVEIPSGRVVKTLPPAGQMPATTRAELIRGNPISPLGMLARMSCLSQLGGFRADLHGCDDYDMWLRVAKASCIKFLPERVGIYRVHGENMSGNWEHHFLDMMASFQELERGQLSIDERQALIWRRAMLNQERAVRAFDAGRFRQAASSYAAAIRWDPFIGAKIPWGRFRHPAYRFLRPYLAGAYCGARSLLASERT